MIVPPCRPLLTLPSPWSRPRPAAVSFLFVFSVDHPLCPSLPGFHQSERDDSESDSALSLRCGNEGEEQSVCVPWPCVLPNMVQSRGKQTAFGNFLGARKHLCVLCMWGALENEGTSDTGCEHVTHDAGDGERAAAGLHSQLPFLPILEAETHWHWQNDSLPRILTTPISSLSLSLAH